MRKLCGVCLLLYAMPLLAAALEPAIREVAIDNRGDDQVLVVLSRPSGTQPFLYSNRLEPGARDVVRVPDLPSLLVDVLRRSDVKRAQLAEQPPRHGDDKKKRQRQALVLGLAFAAAKRGGHDDEHEDKHHDERERDDEPEREEQQQQQQVEDGGREPDEYGRGPGDAGRDVNPGTQHVLLSNMLGGTHSTEDRADPLPPITPTQEREVSLDAGAGDGTRVVNGVGLAVSTEPASAPPPAPTPPRASTPAPASSETCYCGPDASAAYLEALRRAFGRIQKLSNDQKGAWDGTWFLSRNAGSLDERVRPARAPGANAGEDSAAGVICPSGACANLPGAGGGTIRLFGHCLPQHVGNDIMYGFVATLLDVPTSIQRAGGHWAQLNSTYSSLDPPQSQAAYEIGRQLAEMEDSGTRGPFYDLAGTTAAFDSAVYWTGTGLAEVPKQNNAVGFILGVYPALASCGTCPADAKETATLLRDWTNSVWDLGEGKKNYPAGYTEGE